MEEKREGKILKQTVHYLDSVLMRGSDKVIFLQRDLQTNPKTSRVKPGAAITGVRQTERHE